MDDQNRYLFHWLSPDTLEGFHREGILDPKWSHYVLEAARFVKGVSTTDEPMLWNPDEGKRREPCLVIDRERIGHPVHAISSSETFHLTKEVRRLKRARQDIQTEIDRRWKAREFSRWTPDEYFVEGPITWDAVVLIGFEDDERPSTQAMIGRVRAVAEERGIGMLDMTGWEVGSPGIEETDGIIEETMREAMQSPRP